jgi:hypothetical protein
MAIRTNTNPRAMDLQPEMRDILMRNGLQAHIAFDGGGYKLIVQGHDSPLLTYQITEKQLLALTDWGTNTANKKAYNVLTSILAKDFYLPKTLSMPAMLTDVWRWVCTATVSEWVNTGVQAVGGCFLPYSDGHRASRAVFICAGSADSSFSPERPLSPNVLTDA